MAKNNKIYGKAASVLLQAGGIMVLAWLLSQWLMAPFSLSAGSMFASGDRRDFNVTDFYHMVSNQRAVRTLDSDIIIINIDHSNREDITDLLEAIAPYDPKAVGIDVIFPQQKDDDERLIAALRSLPNVVMSMTAKRIDGSKNFTPAMSTWFAADSLPQVPVGIVNMPAKFAKSTIRNFVVQFPVTEATDSDATSTHYIPSFPVALAQAYKPKTVDALDLNDTNGIRTEAINYPSREFTIITPEEFYEDPQIITNKLVLIGAVNQSNDMHITPINDRMSGVPIHAYSTATILNQAFYTSLSTTANQLLACALCLFIAILCIWLHVGIKGLVLRITQVALLYALIRVGFWLFIDKNTIVDISYALLMLTFGLFAADIWIGFRTFGKWTLQHFNKETKTTSQPIDNK